MAKMIIEIENDQDATQMVAVLDKSTTAPDEFLNEFMNQLNGSLGGAFNAVINVKLGAVAASRSGTFTGAPSAAETITINGVVFTARASGAVANEFNIGGTVTLTAAALAAAVNASVTAGVVDVVSASSALGVVTFTSKQAGKAGNGIVLSEALSNFTLAGTTLTGGTQSTNKTYQFGKAPTTAY